MDMQTRDLQVPPAGLAVRQGTASAAVPGPGGVPLIRRTVEALQRANAFVAGLLIGLSFWTPVFVATADEPEWHRYAMPGSLALFGAGLWLRAGRLSLRRLKPHPRHPAGPSHPDMNRLAA